MPIIGKPRFAGLGLACLLAAGTVFGMANGSLAKTGDVTVETVGNRADLVSGGDVLVRVALPAGDDAAKAMISVNGKVLSDGLHVAPDGKGFIALVTGLKDGKNALAVTSKSGAAHLDITNHPRGGPLFSGPQIQPWTCLAGSTGAQCDRASTYAYSYMPKGASAFKPYSPATPAADVASVTTSGGVSAPYIVRVESFNQDRSGVSVATLFDPAKPWTPFTPQKTWNRGVLVLQGSGCGTGYGEQPAGSPMNDQALRKGFLVVTVALLHNTINCNPVVQAEAALMAKEHVAETYGPFDMFFGMGGSGGAISQIMDQNAYPGLYDGLILNLLFADSDASRKAAYDCRMVYDYWAKPGSLPYTDPQKVAVVGQLSGCNSSPTRYEIYAPSIGTNCTVANDAKFDEVARPKGVRCTLADYEVNEVGRRPDGAAYGRLDNEGVQYGLKALQAGVITPAQFTEMNAAIAGHDINFKPIATRTVADRAGLKALYASGLNNTENNLASTPILETRPENTDFHQPFHHVMVLARLDRAQGNHNNYVTWRSMKGRDPAFDTDFDTMVAWIKAIQADTRNVPKAQKVAEDKPVAAHDRCTLGDGKDQPMTACPRPLELTRAASGAPDTNDVGKCALKPLNKADYGSVSFTADQWTALQGRFKTGVCDYSKPMVDFQMSIPWMTYADGKGGKPLPSAPVSR
jgi:hypothetical protein